jgi:hypothetical protein
LVRKLDGLVADGNSVGGLYYLGDYDPHGLRIFLEFARACPEAGLRWVGLQRRHVVAHAERSLPFFFFQRGLE